MSGEYDALIVAGTEKQKEIQVADRGTTSSKSGQSKEVPFKDVIRVTEDKDLLAELKDVRINISSSRTHSEIKIQKVPEIMLRNGDLKEYFTPMEMSIGPIYAADPILFKKELKLKLAAHFLKIRNGPIREDLPVQNEGTGEDLHVEIKNDIEGIKACFDVEAVEQNKGTGEDLLVEIKNDIEGIKACFDVEVVESYSDEELIRMLFLDGCAMLGSSSAI